MSKRLLALRVPCLKRKNVAKSTKLKEYPAKNVRNLTKRHDSIITLIFFDCN
jgi:hypothetical protein